MKLKDYLYRRTVANSLAVIRDGGWVKGIVYIDYEDLSTLALPQNLLNKTVVQEEFRDDFMLAGQTIKCYVIEIE